MANTPKTTTAAILPIGTTALEKPNQLLEDLNFVNIEALYFCLDLGAIPKRKGTFEYHDGNRGWSSRRDIFG